MDRICRAGFSLIEMSAVLAIITLIVAAVFEGRSLIHNAQLQAMANDFNKYGTAYTQFKQLYNVKPGDFYNATNGQKATDIWGHAGGTAPNYNDVTCFNALSANSPATCNGNANNGGAGINYIAGPYNAGVLSDPNEIYLAWQQLSAGKMLDQTYSGNPTGGASAGANVPAGQLDHSAYMFLSQDVIVDAASATNSPHYFYGNYGTLKTLNSDGVTYTIKPGTYIVLGSIGSAVTGSGLSSNMPENELLQPDEASLIDKKLDDGLPASGQIMTYLSYPDGSAAGNCVVATSGGVTAGNNANIIYNSSNTNPACNLIYINDVVLN